MKKAAFLEKFTAACQAYEAKKYQEAFELFQPLAEMGEPVSQYRLGIFYFLGLYVKQSEQEAFKWISKSAESNYPAALSTTGEMLLVGEGVEKDIHKGIYKLVMAAGYGVRKAQALACLAYGHYVNDPANTYFWGVLSKNNPSGDAEQNQMVEKLMKGLQAKLTPEQIQAATDKAKNWQALKWEPPADLFED